MAKVRIDRYLRKYHKDNVEIDTITEDLIRLFPRGTLLQKPDKKHQFFKGKSRFVIGINEPTPTPIYVLNICGRNPKSPKANPESTWLPESRDFYYRTVEIRTYPGDAALPEPLEELLKKLEFRQITCETEYVTLNYRRRS